MAEVLCSDWEAADSWFLFGTNSTAIHLSEQFLALKNYLQGIRLLEAQDKIVWPDGCDKLTVSEAYKNILLCRRKFFDPGVFHFQWETVWKKNDPSKIAFTV